VPDVARSRARTCRRGPTNPEWIRGRWSGGESLPVVEVRAQGAGETDAVNRVITEAFADGGDVAALWTDVVARGLDRASLVAVDGGDVVGHIGLSHGWLDARRELVDVLILSPLSVRPDRQGEGAGTALVAAAIGNAKGLGAPAVFLEGSPSYYGRRGFQPAGRWGFEAPSRRTPEPAFQVALLSGHVGWMVGRVVYHDVWWEHDRAGLRDPDLARIERDLGIES
jgi:putative acetyltransferase